MVYSQISGDPSFILEIKHGYYEDSSKTKFATEIPVKSLDMLSGLDITGEFREQDPRQTSSTPDQVKLKITNGKIKR